MMGLLSLNSCHIKTIWMVPFFFTLLSGCEAIMDMDRPIAPPDLLWEKKGVSGRVKNADMRQCGQLSLQASGAESWEIHDVCMLKKGYKFIPYPQGLPHWEKEGTYWVSNLNDPILVECAHKSPGDTLSAEELFANLDMLNACMSNKGYTYKPSEGRWRNICALQTFGEGVACKSTRWGFILPPEK